MKSAATVGVYGFTAAAFLAALRDAWANSRRLQDALSQAGIEYSHHPELAPTTELRRLQYRADDREGVGKRSRVTLAPEYVEGYTREVLDRVDVGPIVEEMPEHGRAALLCVERDPEACHRLLIAHRIEAEQRVEFIHLRPPAEG